ncbi:Binding partner of ACD11 1 [Linum perenne]
MSVNTVKVSNVSMKATDKDLKEFFSFSGDIQYVHMETSSEDEKTQVGYVTFKDSQGAETAILLSGATIVDLAVTISLDPYYKLPQSVLTAMENEAKDPATEQDSALRNAEDVVSSMLAKGYILGKDAVNKAKSFDEKHQLTSTGFAKVKSFDEKIGLTDKISASTTVMGDKVREVDQRYQVTEKTKSALAAAEQTVSTAGSKIMKNRYVFTSAAWVTGAFSRVAKAAEDVGQKAKEKAEGGEERKKAVDEDQQKEKEGPSPHTPSVDDGSKGVLQSTTTPDEHPKSPPSKPTAPIQ